MRIRYVWQAYGRTFKTLKAARAWCSRNVDGLSIISRIRA